MAGIDGQPEPVTSARRPRKRSRLRVLLLIVGALVGLVLILVVGRSVFLGLLERSDASSDSGAPLPQTFPGDFPLYHPASLSLIESDPDTAVFVGKWITVDSQAMVVTFYRQHLNEEDLQAVDARMASGRTLKGMYFRRKSANNYVGTIVISPQDVYGVATIWVCTAAASSPPNPCP